MAEELGARLVRAGLVTRDQLARALARGAVQGGALAAALLDGGLSGDALAGFFVADGFGPLLDVADLAKAQPGPLRALPPEMAHSLLALPVRNSPAGIVVAMADPSDAHAVAELRYATGGDVLPTVAKVPDLKLALERAYPMLNAREGASEEAPSEPPLELTRRKGSVATNTSAREDEVAVPLVSKKPLPTPPADRSAVPTRTFSKPASAKFASPQVPGSPNGNSDAEAAPSRKSPPPPPSVAAATKAANIRGPAPAKAPEPANPVEPPVAERTAPSTLEVAPASVPVPLETRIIGGTAAERISSMPPRTSSTPPRLTPEEDGNSWGSLSEKTSPGDVVAPTPTPTPAAPPVRRAPAPPRGKAAPKTRRESRPPGEIGSTLAAIRSSEDRDAVVRSACEGGLTVARSTCLLALRKGVLKGWDGVGGGVSQDAIRNLWIPATSPSIFKQVLDSGAPYFGVYGTSAADNLYRASTGSRGGKVSVQPVCVKGRTVAVLVADDVRYDKRGVQRLEVLAQAVGDAFKRIITAARRS